MAGEGEGEEEELTLGAIGRNRLCRCGSGKKTKRCCGMQRGPSDEALAKAFLATEARLAARRLIHLHSDEVHKLFEQRLELPARHLSLQVPLPRLSPPELEALRHALDDEDPDAADDHLDAVLARIDTPQQRALLARDVLDLARSGATSSQLADVALVDLDSGSRALLRASLLQAVAVSVGAIRTPPNCSSSLGSDDEPTPSPSLPGSRSGPRRLPPPEPSPSDGGPVRRRALT